MRPVDACFARTGTKWRPQSLRRGVTAYPFFWQHPLSVLYLKLLHTAMIQLAFFFPNSDC